MVRIAAFLYFTHIAVPAVAATQQLDLWDVSLSQHMREDYFKTLTAAEPSPMPPKRQAALSPGWGSLAQVWVLTVAAVLLARHLPGPRRHAVAAAEASPRIR